ncbi:DNA-directed RNA polymerase III subunit RPC6 [Orchesella cincta]|uniref:DNA-directed RNA polymerase III subunit RPC6 n=1 Tax=Orchesella cincta TaxID=48709 RepID=A0A1D2N2K0_ORCCI|nr:DNA-directed RNA polymerase III subunit RPC6 [Orchesella cincta]
MTAAADNYDISTLTDFEKRILELTKEFPKGIPDKIVQNDMPAITGPERASAINNLLALGLLDLYKQGNDLLYKLKPKVTEPDQMKNADSEEKVVYDIIKEAGNMGIWIRDIRVQSNLLMTQLNKIVKSLESKKLIKAVKSVSASKKKVYMLYDLEPHRSLTGGAWYSDQDFESEFVTILNQQCYRYLCDKKERANSTPLEFGPKAARIIALTSLDELHKFISNLGISKVELTKEDIETILNTLIYDGKVERVFKEDKKMFIAIDSYVDTAGYTQVPCGVCPVAEHCSERGAINPSSCIYMDQWLEPS